MNKFCPSLIGVLLFAGFLSGCSPRLSPLYRDFEVKPLAGVSNDDVFLRMNRGLLAAGWSPSDGPTENVLATEPRQFRQWGVYGIEVDLELAPVAGEYVRVLIHPYRVYFTGKRSKIPYLRGSLARSILSEIQETFEAEGLTFIGTAESRNKAAVKER